MNHTESENPERSARIINAVRARQWKLQLLTGVAVTVGLLSILAGIALAWGYRVKIEPKLEELQAGYTAYDQAQQTAATNTIGQPGLDAAQVERYRASRDRLHMTMTHALGVQSMLIAASVALVGIGTFITIVLVMATRRSTFRQINENLEMISDQLRQLQNRSN